MLSQHNRSTPTGWRLQCTRPYVGHGRSSKLTPDANSRVGRSTMTMAIANDASQHTRQACTQHGTRHTSPDCNSSEALHNLRLENMHTPITKQWPHHPISYMIDLSIPSKPCTDYLRQNTNRYATFTCANWNNFHVSATEKVTNEAPAKHTSIQHRTRFFIKGDSRCRQWCDPTRKSNQSLTVRCMRRHRSPSTEATAWWQHTRDSTCTR